PSGAISSKFSRIAKEPARRSSPASSTPSTGTTTSPTPPPPTRSAIASCTPLTGSPSRGPRAERPRPPRPDRTSPLSPPGESAYPAPRSHEGENQSGNSERSYDPTRITPSRADHDDAD